MCNTGIVAVDSAGLKTDSQLGMIAGGASKFLLPHTPHIIPPPSALHVALALRPGCVPEKVGICQK